MLELLLSPVNKHYLIKPPERMTLGAAGYDLYAAAPATIYPGDAVKIPIGYAAAIPEGYVGLIHDRSSLAAGGLKVGGGVIDSDYRGEIMVLLLNISNDILTIGLNERCGQLLLVPIATPAPRFVSQLPATDRGTGGFGSTGK